MAYTSKIVKQPTVNDMRKGKQFGVWLNDKEIEETNIEDEIKQFGGNTSAYFKHKLDELQKYKTALKELYELMGSSLMEFTVDTLSPRDLKFIDYVTGLVKE